MLRGTIPTSVLVTMFRRLKVQCGICGRVVDEVDVRHVFDDPDSVDVTFGCFHGDLGRVGGPKMRFDRETTRLLINRRDPMQTAWPRRALLQRWARHGQASAAARLERRTRLWARRRP